MNASGTTLRPHVGNNAKTELSFFIRLATSLVKLGWGGGGLKFSWFAPDSYIHQYVTAEGTGFHAFCHHLVVDPAVKMCTSHAMLKTTAFENREYLFSL